MEKRITPQMKIGLIAMLLMPAGIAFAATPPLSPPAAEAVRLTGWLHVEDYTMEDVTVQVDVDGVTHTETVSENGRFTVTLPADAEVVLRFEKPGHLPKEVKVDTRHVRDGDFGQRKKRKVSFAVIMQLERQMGGLTYPGPVGTIGFDSGGGCLAVVHDRKLIPASQAPMVF